MDELTLSQQYAIIAFNGLESLHSSMAKEAVLRATAAAKVLEGLFKDKGECDAETFISKLNEALECAKSLKKKEGKALEKDIFVMLEADGLMEMVPDILGCDMNYYTTGVELKAYRSEERIYLKLREGLRAEILDEGLISIECAVLLWLHRESGCIHDLFSIAEQSQVQSRMMELSVSSDIYRKLWEAEFHNVMKHFAGRYLRAKKELFKNPYLEGMMVHFPYLDRRQAIFIDCVVFGTNVKERRIAAMEHLCKMGHYVEEVKNGTETLLKVDNLYYRIFPKTVCVGGAKFRVPIQGVQLMPVYW